MNYPNYKDVRLIILSELETSCRKCTSRFVDRGGKVQCPETDCRVHQVRAQALAISPTAFQTPSSKP